MWVEVCMSSGACVCVCLFVTHTMQQDHTVLLVCGISRFKIGLTVGGGQEQTAERGEKKKRETQRRTGTTHSVCFHSSKDRIIVFIRTQCLIYPPVSKSGRSFSGLLKWEVIRVDRWKVARYVQLSLLTHWITV